MKKASSGVRGVFEKPSGSGCWWARFQDQQGRIRVKKIGIKSAAERYVEAARTKVRTSDFLPEKPKRRLVSFAEIAQDALAYSKRHKITYDDDVSRMTRLLEWFRGSDAAGITPTDIEARFNQAIEDEGWKASTVNHYRSLLSLTYRLGIRNDKVSANPARAVPHRREDNSRVRWLTPEEERKLREVIADKYPEHVPELDFALNTGLRLSEQYRLTWENINLPQRFLKISRSKNGEARYVRLNKTALGALLAFRSRGDGTGPVIRNAQGEPLAGPRHWFEPAIREAGLEDFHWHDLRHTFASRLVMAGVNLRAVQEALGHKSIAMTVRYAHLAPDYQLAAVEKLDEVYGSTPTVGLSETGIETGPVSQSQPGSARLN